MKKAAYMTGLFVAAAALTATGAVAFGPGGGGPMERPSFKTLGTDGDGQITLPEIEAMGMARFAGADADGDGMLSLAELEAHAQQRAASRAALMIERFDKDGDGALSVVELPKPGKGMGRMIEHFDTDDSGGISEEEFAAASEKMKGHGMGRMKGHMKGHGMDHGYGQGHGKGFWGKNQDKN